MATNRFGFVGHKRTREDNNFTRDFRPQQRPFLKKFNVLDNKSAEDYHPLKAGSIDGTDKTPHDHGIVRAMQASYSPSKDPEIKGDPYKTLYVGRLNWETTEETLKHIFEGYGPIQHFRLVRNIVTGQSKGYAFVTYKHYADFECAWRELNKYEIDGQQILVEYERERVMKGWVPRRLGGGIGGKKESGQLRFGGRDRPFRAPLEVQAPNPLEVEGIHSTKIGVVAGVRLDSDDEEETHVYLKQKGKKVHMEILSPNTKSEMKIQHQENEEEEGSVPIKHEDSMSGACHSLIQGGGGLGGFGGVGGLHNQANFGDQVIKTEDISRERHRDMDSDKGRHGDRDRDKFGDMDRDRDGDRDRDKCGDMDRGRDRHVDRDKERFKDRHNRERPERVNDKHRQVDGRDKNRNRDGGHRDRQK